MSDVEARPEAAPWTLPGSDAARLELAKGYPYFAPAESYLFRDGAVHPIAEADFTGRTAVLGHGSNRAPEQLARKFHAFRGADSEIPVTFVWLHDYDVVYSAHITTYGAIASNLHHVRGCRVRVGLTWLDARQLERMHETEGNYSFGRLVGARVESEAGPNPEGHDIMMYLSDHGCLLREGEAVALSAVPAEGRPYRAMTQDEIQREVRSRLAPGADPDAFILDSIRNSGLRYARIRALRARALTSCVPHFEAAGGLPPEV